MALAETRQLDLVLKLKDQASSGLKNFSMELGLLKKASAAASIGISAVGAGLVAAGVSAVKSASDFEQNRIAFEGMLGSAEKAKTLLRDITELGKTTPFELPQLVTASKQLLAYGVAQEDIIPKLKMLGDISATVGMDKMPELILAFGQVKAKGKLAGQEMLQFTNTGIGLRDALVRLANEGKGAFASLKGLGASSGKSSVNVGELNDKLAIANQRMKEMKKKGTASKSSMMSLANTIENYKEKISKAGDKTSDFSKTGTLAWEDLEKAMSKGLISYDMVSEALASMTAEGGIAHDAMIRQSKSLAGVISNLQDYLGIFLRDLVGMSTEGDVREGSIFFYIKQGAVALYDFLENNKDVITSTFTNAVSGAIQSTKDWYESIGGAEGLKQKLSDAWETIKTVVSAIMGFTGFVWEHRKAILYTIAAWEIFKTTLAITELIAGLSTAFGILGTSMGMKGAAGQAAILSKTMGMIPLSLVITIGIGSILAAIDAAGQLNQALNDLDKAQNDFNKNQSKLIEAARKKKESNPEQYKKEIEAIERAAKENARIMDEHAKSFDWIDGLNNAFAGGPGGVANVNDAIITPRGDVIKTDPSDYLIATKTPGALAGASSGGVTVNVNYPMVLDRSAGEKLAQVLSETLRTKLRI